MTGSRRAPRIVLAPDKFKGSLTAAEVVAALAEGILEARPDAQIVRIPVADGGDGTVAAALARDFDPVRVTVTGPTGAVVDTAYARRGHVAIVELASVCGLQRLPDGVRDPRGASTFGLGQAMGHAVRAGVREIVLGIGGSASTDGGAGMVQALGARLRDAAGDAISPGGGGLTAVATVDLEPVRHLMDGVRVRVASDVDNPLLGPRGSAVVFAPQKGATAEDVTLLERALSTWAHVVTAAVGSDHSGRPGAGAAGGTGFAASAILGAEITSGIDLVLDLLRFDDALAGADLVVTGEGSLDQQSLAGKAPLGVAAAAGAAGIDVVAVAGICELTEEDLRRHGIRAVHVLSDLEPDPQRSMADAAALLRQVGKRIVSDLGVVSGGASR